MISIKSIQPLKVGSRVNKLPRMSRPATLWLQIQLLWILSKIKSLRNAKPINSLWSHSNMGPIKIRCLEHFQKTDTVNSSKFRVKVIRSHNPMMAEVRVIEIMGVNSILISSQNIFFTLHLVKRKVNYFLLTFHKTLRLLVGIRLGDCKHQIDMILKVLEMSLNFSRKPHRLKWTRKETRLIVLMFHNNPWHPLKSDTCPVKEDIVGRKIRHRI